MLSMCERGTNSITHYTLNPSLTLCKGRKHV